MLKIILKIKKILFLYIFKQKYILKNNYDGTVKSHSWILLNHPQFQSKNYK